MSPVFICPLCHLLLSVPYATCLYLTLRNNDGFATLHHTQLFAFTQLKNWKLGKCEDDILIAYDPDNFSVSPNHLH